MLVVAKVVDGRIEVVDIVVVNVIIKGLGAIDPKVPGTKVCRLIVAHGKARRVLMVPGPNLFSPC